MRKIPLTILALYVQLLVGAAQAQQQDSAYKERKLRDYEVNFVGSYYVQDGNNSAVTGGIGDEHLTDISSAIDLTINTRDTLNNLKSLRIELAADAYSSASSDKIDPQAFSSASGHDTRIYPSVAWNSRNEAHHYSFGAEGSFSTEYDYTSIGAGINFSKFSKDNNREIGIKLLAFFDTWEVILPVEFRSSPDAEESSDNKLGIDVNNNKRNSFDASLVYSQIVDPRFQFAIVIDPSWQQGLLATLYQRIYFNDGSEAVERLPDSRFKLPIGLRMNWFATDKLILRSFLRYYTDDWNINAGTASIEVPFKLTALLSLSPFYRYYTQTAAKYFAGYKEHAPSEEFYTSDYDLSKFDSHFVGINILKSSLNGILGIKAWNAIELRYGYYMRSNGLTANTVTLAATFK